MHEWQELEALKRRRKAPRPDRPEVMASDVAAFAFCGRSWWLRRQDPFARGARAHSQVGAAIDAWATFRVLIWTAVGGAGVMGAVGVWLLVR